MTERGTPAVFRRTGLEPGLHLVATPIGAARDITLRALDVLASAEVLVAEDTRVLRRLMELHGIPRGERPVLSYHDHNGPAQRPRLLGLLGEGRSLAYASDAGTPLVADPGFRLAQAAIAAGHAVHAVPGPSSALAALSVAGLPTDRFLFAGFPPAQAGARARWLAEILPIPASLVIFESGRRAGALLEALEAAGAGARGAALCRELTKRHEEIRRGTIAELAATAETSETRGEMVLVLGPPVARAPAEADVAAALEVALQDRPLKQAAAEVAARLGVRKRDVYQMGLEMRKADGD
jgi:16S rRNA (cytidine1402-2'-O)-methyltransferase